ncbi:uncharacterized protein LOC131022965 [Salvia miltiorrhiza]|uniref:uncharacterized protein LOC131022965 n=1 Tax=Salvia miltiorrhiza TaxID=226208 RepID=UPI0025AC9976|nr:uncharacterized protein LOC131022965 [Salvia miltiorrhiza]
MAAVNQRSMRDFARPVVEPKTSSIVLGDAAKNYVLKPMHFSQLPSFYGMPSEDALNFIREFYSVVTDFPPQGLNTDQLKMKCFPYTLKDKAKVWFMSLEPNSLRNWDAVYEKFMAKYYSNQKTQELRAQIVTFAQNSGETFHEAWDRFRSLQRQCPHHHLPPALLNQFFYDGLAQNFQYMVDNAAGGDIGNRTAEEVNNIFETMASNSQQKSARGGRRAAVNEATPSYDVTRQLAELTRQVELLRVKDSKSQQVMSVETCGICGESGHGANLCPKMGEPIFEDEAQVNALQGFQPRPKLDPFAPTYNPGWRNHPNFSWRQNQGQCPSQNAQNFQQPQQPNQPQYQQQQPGFYRQQQYPNQQAPPKKPSLEDSLNAFIQSTNQRFESVEASIKRIETQVGQIAGTVGKLDQQNTRDKLPSHSEQAHAISILRSGKVVDNKVEYPQADESSSQEAESSKSGEKKEDAKEEEEKKDNGLHKAANPYTPPIPFPSRLRNAKQDQQFNDFYKLLSKVNVNLPLLDMIRNVPAYVKFFKELASKKRKFADDEKIVVSEVASAILQQQLPPKQRDPGSFVIKIALGNGKEASGMLDLGAGINLMPFSIFEQLELGDLKPTRLCLQLADRSVRYPKGIVEDILVKVGGLIIPVDFVVLDVGDVRENGKEHTLLLGRPFMATTNTLIDVKNGTL